MTYIANRTKFLNAPRSQSMWWLFAIVLGLVLGTQSNSISVGLMALIVFFVTSGITPLALLAILLILAPMRTLILTESSLQLPIDIGQLLLLCLIAFWVSTLTAYKQYVLQSVKWSPIYVLLLLFVLTISISAFVSLSLGIWLNEWLKWNQVLILVIIVVSFIRHDQWMWPVYALMVAGVANAMVGIYEFLGGSGALHLLINGQFFRAFGTFGQPNPFGAFMGMLAPLGIMMALGYTLRFFDTWQSRRRISWQDRMLPLAFGLAASIIIVGLGASWSRGAWLGFLASTATIVVLMPRKAWQSITLLLALMSFVGVLWFSNQLPVSISGRVEDAAQEIFQLRDARGQDITPENFAVLERVAHWQAAIDISTNHPWLGVGTGNYEVAYPQYRLLNWPEPLGHAHNYYLNTLAETGIVGLTGYLVMWVGIFGLGWRTRQHPDPIARAVAIGLLGAGMHIMIHSLTDNLYVNNLFLHIGIMFGILALLHRQVHRGVKIKL